VGFFCSLFFFCFYFFKNYITLSFFFYSYLCASNFVSLDNGVPISSRCLRLRSFCLNSSKDSRIFVLHYLHNLCWISSDLSFINPSRFSVFLVRQFRFLYWLLTIRRHNFVCFRVCEIFRVRSSKASGSREGLCLLENFDTN
jgi:hypothetical protein